QGFGIKLDRIPTGEYKILGQITAGKTEGVIYALNYYKNNGLKIKSVTLDSLNFEVENIDYDYLQLEFKNGSEVTTIGYDYIMVVPKDVTLNSYIERKTDKKDILIKEPLRSIEDIQDVIYEDNGQVKVNRYNKKIIIGGNENLIEINNSGSMYGVKLKIEEGKSYSKFISNSKIGYDERWNVTEWENYYPIAFNFDNNIGYITILFSKNKISSITNLETCKQYLRENNIELYYQLATPIVEIVENCIDIDLDTYQEKSYFNILNSLPGTLDFKVPSNLGSVVQNMAKEVNEIWDVINNLLVPGLLDTKKEIARKTIKNNLK
ncbi:hypothetical protein I9Y31_003460, partial [Clostridium perfringens]|nr:hypothetical protein [Clostridium perfringens]